jgi:hypothetical protein
MNEIMDLAKKLEGGYDPVVGYKIVSFGKSETMEGVWCLTVEAFQCKGDIETGVPSLCDISERLMDSYGKGFHWEIVRSARGFSGGRDSHEWLPVWDLEVVLTDRKA